MKNKIIEALDERYMIYSQLGERNEDWLYYAGMLNLVERMGFYWERNENGNHKLYK